MGMIDNIRNFFNGSNKPQVTQEDDSYKKSMLATQIINLVGEIKRINSFDSSVWNLSNMSTHDLQKRSLAELEKMQASLNSRLVELNKQSQTISKNREALEESIWTGQKPQNLTDHEFDRLQRSDERY